MRLGILGGTFDPIHLGHLRLAEDVAEDFELKSVFLVPAACPPHKEERFVSPFRERWEMTQLAAGESPLLEAIDLENRREGFSYSIETLREFHRLFLDELALFFIVGADAFLQIETWKEYPKLFDYAHFVIIERPGARLEGLESFLFSLKLGFRKKDDEAGIYIAPSGNRLFCKTTTLMDISSTGIRNKVARGKSIRFLVPDSIRKYIIEKGLYQNSWRA